MELEDGMDESSSGESDSSTDSSSTSSTDDSSLDGSDNSSSSSEESVQSTKLEDCKVNGITLQLPQGLCEHEDLFEQVLSMETWESLSDANKEHLRKFLPRFPSHNEEEQENTLKLLFSGENICFGNPLKDFHRNLKSGYFRPDIARMRRLLRKALNREYNYSQKRYYFRVMKSVLTSRQKLLQAANVLPPGVSPKVPKLPAPPRTLQFSTRVYRTRRRYFQELRAVRQEVGESGHSSDDENYPEGPPAQINKKLKRRLATLESTLSPEIRRVVSTLAAKPAGLDLAANVTASFNPYEPSDDTYRNMLTRHKKRRLAGDTHPELHTLGRTLQDIVDRANRVIPKKGSAGNISIKGESTQLPSRLTPKPPAKRRNSKFQPETSAAVSPSHLAMADSSNNSDMAESDDDDDLSSVTRLMEDDDRLRKDGRERDVDIDRELESKELLKEKEKDHSLRLKEREQDLFATGSPISSSSKAKKPPVSSPRSGKPNHLTGLPTNRRLLKGEVEDAVDSLLASNLLVQHSHSPQATSQAQTPTLRQTLSYSSPRPVQDQLQGKQPPQPAQQQQTGHTPSSFPNTQASILSDLTGVDMTSLPANVVEAETEVNVEDVPATPSLMQDTHACFFSLLRDIICCASNQSMSLSLLQSGLRKWQESPISPLNDWYSLATGTDGWVSLLPSALTFLSGQVPDMHPDEFVPYLDYKPAARRYQWIGAGRDNDNLLIPLCTYWLERRDEAAGAQAQAQANALKESEENVDIEDDELVEFMSNDSMELMDRVGSPPPSYYPTDWVVRPSTDEEKTEFREQELERFANPLRAFIYKMHGYESVVGPVKGVYSTGSGNIKPRGHSLLVADRPNYVTILALVRDAAARLPNGQGTRAEICELLKDSQYVKQGGDEAIVTTVVSGALDRLHYERDPCVKYDLKRKIWIHLHRSRTVEEYEQMHQQQQGQGKPRSTRKTTSRVKKEKEKKGETKAAAAASVSQPLPGAAATTRLAPQVEAEVTNMPTGLHTIQVTTRPAPLSSGSLWNTPMELTPLPSTPNSVASSPLTSTTSSTASASGNTPTTPPTPSTRTVLATRLPSTPTARKTTKKQTVVIDGLESVVPIPVPVVSNARSVLGPGSPSSVADSTKPVQQQLVMGGRIVATGAGRKSLVMTNSSGVQQVVQLSPASKQSVVRPVGITQPGTILLSAAPTSASSPTTANTSVGGAAAGTTVQWTAVTTSPSTGQRQTMLIQQPQQVAQKVERKQSVGTKTRDPTVPVSPRPSHAISSEATAQSQMKQQQMLLVKQRQQQLQQQVAQQQAAQQQAAQQQAVQQQAAQQQAAQQQVVQQQVAQQQVAQQQVAQQQAAQQQLVAQQQPTVQQVQQVVHQQISQQQQNAVADLSQLQVQEQEQPQEQLHLHQQIQQKQQQQLQAQQKVALSPSQKQLQQQTLQLLQQQLKEKPGSVNISNIQLVDQSGTVMAVQTSESQTASGRPRQNLVLVRQPSTDQAAQLTAMVQKQQQLLLLKQKQQQQGSKELTESQQLQIRQRQVQEILKQQLKNQQAIKSQSQASASQLQQQILVVSGASQQQIKQQQQQQLVVLKQQRGQGQQTTVVNAVGGLLPQQMFVVKSKTGGMPQKQVLTQLTAEQQAGLLALQRQQQQQQQQQQQIHQTVQQQPAQQTSQQQIQQQLHQIQQQQQIQQTTQHTTPIHIQQSQLQTTPVSQIQQQSDQLQRQTAQQQLQQGKVSTIGSQNVRGNSLLSQGILTTAALTSATVTSSSGKQGPPPMVAKVVTNQQGQQVITMEALLNQAQAQGKAGTLRVAAAGGKAGQTNLIQLAGTGAGGVPQFAMVTQGSIISLGGSINAQRVVPQTFSLAASGAATTVVTASKATTGAGSVANTTIAQPGSNLRMVSGAGLNIAHIGGKPVLLASKPQGLQGQNVILTSPGGGQQTVLLASQALRPTASSAGGSGQTTAAPTNTGALVLQQAGGAQQILLPPGFQGGTINLKGLQGIQGLQGLKVIPIAQAGQGGGVRARQQMFARIITPSSIRATGVQQGLVQQAPASVAVAVAGAASAGTTTVAAAPSAAPTSVPVAVQEQTSLQDGP